jgi:hypothetical protein
MKLRGTLEDVGSLSGSDRDAMFQLMQRSYANMRRDRFDLDLNAKQWVILVRSPESHRLVGFSTQMMLEARLGSELVRALYSGDTVMDRDHWGDPTLPHVWGNFALQLIDPQVGPLFWFLTSKGFRTYRYLPLFFRSYFPRPHTATPAWEQSLIDALGARIGHEWYDPGRQIIRACPGKDFVRSEIAEPGMRLNTDPHIRFFVERNPGFAQGDELCCLAPLTRENFTRAAYRVIEAQSASLKAV